ncbi:MAG: DNA polymerase III subunit gamma/tau [Bacteroidetes bacterium QS_9_68_14]|nr:MAG: DNA polymerase III subunit gamma/tau [Bacteroidetes bacterium QS_9_68_14]
MPDDAPSLGDALGAPGDSSSSGSPGGSDSGGHARSDEASEARYLVTARKYRPALFSELAAQSHVTDTLKNALRLDRLAHAYLFSGPRGVGKTTAARILAKAINCTTPLDERPDKAEPCRACESCRSFEAGRSLGIFELDAASNNKVDDIRELRETVRVPPQGTKKKVYIIDEVHMLSKQAFNALLKTLEEPPPHVLFIFATTEPHKVLPTILSRCQRFDFRRVPAGRIAQHLRWICKQEGVDADEGALMLLARKGNGALRDALSAFDQAVSLCGDTLRHDELAEALGVVDADLYFQATRHARAGQSDGMLRLVEKVVGRGYDLQEFLAGLSEHLRNLIVARSMEDTDLIEATDATRARYAETAQGFSEEDLLRLLMVAGEAEDEVKKSAQPRLRLELALLKMASLPRAADLQEALALLRRLERHADSGGDLPEVLGEEPSTSNAPAENAPANDDAPAADDAPSAATDPSPAGTDSTGAEPPSSSPGSSEPSDGSHEASPGASAGRVREPATAAPEPQAPADASHREDASRQEKEAGADEQGPEGDTPSFSNLNPDTPDPGEEEEDPDEGHASAENDESGDDAPPAYDDLFGAPALSGEDAPPSSNESPQDAAGNRPGVAAPGNGDAPAATLATPEGGGGVAAAASVPPAQSGARATPAAVEQLRTHWDALVQDVRADRIDLAACLRDAAPVELNAGTLTVAVPNQFSRRFLMDQESFLLGHVERHLPERATVPSTLHLTLDETSAPGGEDDEDAPADPHAVMQELQENHPVVRTIFEEFGGEMAW